MHITANTILNEIYGEDCLCRSSVKDEAFVQKRSVLIASKDR